MASVKVYPQLSLNEIAVINNVAQDFLNWSCTIKYEHGDGFTKILFAEPWLNNQDLINCTIKGLKKFGYEPAIHRDAKKVYLTIFEKVLMNN
jgi:hypothetical protein